MPRGGEGHDEQRATPIPRRVPGGDEPERGEEGEMTHDDRRAVDAQIAEKLFAWKIVENVFRVPSGIPPGGFA